MARKLLPALAKGDRRLWCSEKFQKRNATFYRILRCLVTRGAKTKWKWDPARATVALVADGEDVSGVHLPGKCKILKAKDFVKSFWVVDHAKSLHGLCGQ